MPVTGYARTAPMEGHGMSTTEPGRNNVDLDEVERLVAALERDLAKVRAGSGELDTLRGEVAQLRQALAAPETAQGELHAGLHGIRALLQKAQSELLTDADYVARIGRMLGM